MTRLRHHERSDDNFYYTAAGEANENVTIYSKNALMESGYIYFNKYKSTIQMQTLRTLLTGLFMATASISMAQVTVSTSQLNGTKWKIKGSTSGDFDEYTMSQRIWRRKDSSFSTYPYYITDTPITSYEYSKFDYSKVGKYAKGRYIVLANDVLKITYCASIQSFDKTKGVFVTKLVTTGLIGTGDGISEYEMVK